FLNSSSVMPEPIPAPVCTSTEWTREVRMRTPAGPMTTRNSRVLISVGTPISMARTIARTSGLSRRGRLGPVALLILLAAAAGARIVAADLGLDAPHRLLLLAWA